MEILKPFDFSTVTLKDFNKCFYEEHEDIAGLTPEEHKKIL